MVSGLDVVFPFDFVQSDPKEDYSVERQCPYEEQSGHVEHLPPQGLAFELDQMQQQHPWDCHNNHDPRKRGEKVNRYLDVGYENGRKRHQKYEIEHCRPEKCFFGFLFCEECFQRVPCHDNLHGRGEDKIESEEENGALHKIISPFRTPHDD